MFHPHLVYQTVSYTSTPKQGRHQSLGDYILDFKFHIRMMAYLDNKVFTFSKKEHQDRFILSLWHAQDIMLQVRSDRIADPWHYTCGNFLNTIHYLHDKVSNASAKASSYPSAVSTSTRSTDPLTARSPLSLSTTGPRNHRSRSTKALGPPRLRHLHALHNEVPPFDIQHVYAIFNDIELPQDDSTEDVPLCQLNSAIMQLTDNVDRYTQRPCIVCNQTGHSFKDCPAMDNTVKVKEGFGKINAYINNLHRASKKLCQSMTETSHHPARQLNLLMAEDFDYAPAPSLDASSLTDLDHSDAQSIFQLAAITGSFAPTYTGTNSDFC